MNPKVLEILTCPECQSPLGGSDQNRGLACESCGYEAATAGDIPLFIPAPDGLRPTDQATLEPGAGTGWRHCNWVFVQQCLHEVAPGSLALEVGAGNGYFRPLFDGLEYLATDIHAYQGLDFVCDLCRQELLRPQCLDVVLMSNLLEHVYDFHGLLDNVGRAHKTGGLLIITVPFMIGLHQQPYDFFRYTHHCLRNLLGQHQYSIEKLELVYTPREMALTSLDNLGLSFAWPQAGSSHWKQRGAHFLTRICRRLILAMAKLCDTDGHAQPLGPNGLPLNKLPMGYQIACRKL